MRNLKEQQISTYIKLICARIHAYNIFPYFSFHGNSIIDGSRRWKVAIKLLLIRMKIRYKYVQIKYLYTHGRYSLYYVDMCTVGSTGIDGLWIIGTVHGHPISGLPHEPMMIFHHYIPLFFFPLFYMSLAPLLRLSFY